MHCTRAEPGNGNCRKAGRYCSACGAVAVPSVLLTIMSAAVPAVPGGSVKLTDSMGSAYCPKLIAFKGVGEYVRLVAAVPFTCTCSPGAAFPPKNASPNPYPKTVAVAPPSAVVESVATSTMDGP